MLESYYELQSKPKAVPQFKDAIKLIWSALPEKANDNAAKDSVSYTHLTLPTIYSV